jgi:hypothetical protein
MDEVYIFLATYILMDTGAKKKTAYAIQVPADDEGNQLSDAHVMAWRKALQLALIDESNHLMLIDLTYWHMSDVHDATLIEGQPEMKGV